MSELTITVMRLGLLVALWAFVVAVVHFMGWTALLYLFLSSAFAIGLHPVGARWIQEHYLTFPGDQETFSYYGPMNVLALNVGYHNEHHDLMRVPWTRLPALKAMARGLANHLESTSDLLADVASTVQSGRSALRSRRALVCRDRADAVAQLRALTDGA